MLLEPILPLVNKNINSTILNMKPIRQENLLGCAIACVVFVLKVNYQDVLDLFDYGEKKANSIGFFCIEIIMALEKVSLRYEYNYIKYRTRWKIYKPNIIVFLKKSKNYPLGHYLCRANGNWMDPWINFPSNASAV